MKALNDKLRIVEEHIKNNSIKVMIIGLGSVGSYLLDYLISRNDEALSIVIVGRNYEKMQTRVNIARVSALIRGVNRSQITIEEGVDLNDIDSIRVVIDKHNPDFIVNSSRAYPGLKYGSISWENLRAYGIWTPLAIRFTKNIMDACEECGTDAIVINTSYSDAVIPWIKSANRSYPDFGSGNLNHLIPRMKYAVADIVGVKDFWNVDIEFSAGHFHDVCISKEGQTEGIELPLKVYYKGKEIEVPHDEVFLGCKIPMPVDQTRNMMNASSNYQIIDSVISTVRNREIRKLFIPGFDGNIGGYPVLVGYKLNKLSAWIDERVFDFDCMNKANRKSMWLDGIEDIADGKLIYTDDLIKKVDKVFGVMLPKEVSYENIEETADFLIDRIIKPQLNMR